MSLSQQSAKSLAGLSFILLIVGGMIGAPEATVFLCAIAALCAIAPVIYGTMTVRIFAALLIVAAVALAVASFGDAQQSMENYRSHGSSPAKTTPAP